MKDRTTAELVCRWVCLVLVYSVSVDSLNWTAQPTNPTEVIQGQDVSLTWNFSLTSIEQADRQSYYGIIWKKFNPLSASYDTIGSRVFVQVLGTVQYAEPQAPHIVVDRAAAIDSATLQINSVQSDDEGRYKIEYFVKISGPPTAFEEFNLTVLEPPEFAYVTSDQVICEGTTVTLSCNATGKPTPNITWTRAFDNVTESALQQVVDGKYVINNVSRSSSGTYRCTADNGAGGPVNRTVRLTFGYFASVAIVNSSNTVNEDVPFNVTCEATGDPKPNVCWIKEDNGQCIDGNILNFTNINRNDAGQYRCEAENVCGNGNKVQSVIVNYKPENVQLNVNITKNKTCAGMKVNFTCTSDANPAVDNYKLYENDDPIGNMDRSGVWVMPLTTPGQFIYRCEANNSVGTRRSGDINVAVEVPVSVERSNIDKNVTEDDNVELSCNASAEALSPTITWSKVGADVIIKGNWLNFTNINKSEAGQYKCFAINTCGNKSRVANINVQFGPSATGISQNITVDTGKSRSFDCRVDGNPEPTITWYNASGTVIYSGKTLNFPSTKLSDTGCYTCSAKNFLGTVNVTHCLVVGEKSTPNANSSVEATWKVKNKNYDQRFEAGETMNETMSQAVKPVGELDNFSIVKYSPGSVIVDFLLRFSQSVSASDVITALKTAAKEGKFGDLIIDPDSIRQGKTPSPTTETVTIQVTNCTNPSFFQDKHCGTKLWLVIVFVVAGVIVFAVVIALVTCMVYKRRKCRKDRKTHPPDDQEELQGNQSGADENAYSQVNGGYADSGPPSANRTDAGAQQPREGENGTGATGQQQLEQQVQGAPPTYAVVDKSTKKKKKEEEKKKKEEEKRKKEKEKKMKEEEKKNKNDSEQNIPQYAVVDKSQKKNKEVVEDAYAQVDMSKKSKKKPKPGEMLYADLGDFQPREMPAVSTSPAPLPPIKRPPAYEETQYADITQFMKGEATLPDANNSQGTEMANANFEGGEEKPKDTAKEGKKEEKPMETQM